MSHVIHAAADSFKLFNANLTSDSRKKITSALASNHQHQRCTLDDLLSQVDKYKKRKLQRSTTLNHIENIITTLDQHAKVVDVLIQQQPDITAIVWGAVRFLIGVYDPSRSKPLSCRLS